MPRSTHPDGSLGSIYAPPKGHHQTIVNPGWLCHNALNGEVDDSMERTEYFMEELIITEVENELAIWADRYGNIYFEDIVYGNGNIIASSQINSGSSFTNYWEFGKYPNGDMPFTKTPI